MTMTAALSALRILPALSSTAIAACEKGAARHPETRFSGAAQRLSGMLKGELLLESVPDTIGYQNQLSGGKFRKGAWHLLLGGTTHIAQCPGNCYMIADIIP